jgi:hypothetical protein
MLRKTNGSSRSIKRQLILTHHGVKDPRDRRRQRNFYLKFLQILFKIFTNFILNFYKFYFKFLQILFKIFTNFILNFYKFYFKFLQILF